MKEIPFKRNTFDRYTETKDISEVAPEWSSGCANCQFGIVLAPDILSSFPLFEGRAVQAHEELILFCECKAGKMYPLCLRKRYNDMGMELRRNILAHISAASVPTVHA